jgi:cell division protein FtsQ
MARKNRRRKSPEQKRAQRSRWLGLLVFLPVKLLIFGALGVGIGLAAYQVACYLKTSPALAVRVIEVQGTQRTREADLLGASGLREGINIFSVDTAEAQKRLQNLPWIRKARVSRIVPDRLVLEVVEHQPVAVINLEGLYYVNRSGEVFKRVQPGEREDLPVLTGVSRNSFRDQPERAGRHIRESLRLMKTLKDLPCIFEKRVAEIHSDELMGPSVVLDPGALTVRLGNQDLLGRLSTLCQLMGTIDRRRLKARSILLYHSGRPGWATVQLEGEKAVAVSCKSGSKTDKE